MAVLLLIDEDQFFLNSALYFLKNDGFEVDTCSDGKIGLEMVQNKRYDVVISNTQLNHISGFELATNIKRMYKTLPIILISPANNILRMSLQDEISYDAYMQKPINFILLKETIHKVLKTITV